MSVRARTTKALAALAFCLMAVMMMAPAASAAYSTEKVAGYVQIADEDEFTFMIQTTPAVGLDADYWNFTVYAEPSAGIPDYGGATNATYYVHIHIYDGATNLTKNVTVAAKNDKLVYSNASHAAAAYAGLVENKSAVLYIEVLNAAGTLQSDYHGNIMIYEESWVASIVVLFYAMIPIVVLMALVNYFKGAGGKGPLGKR